MKPTTELKNLRAYVVELEGALKAANDKNTLRDGIVQRLTEALEDNKAHLDAANHYRKQITEKDHELRELRELLNRAEDDANTTRRDLDRCLGWIAKASDQPPLEFTGIPF